jgi:hypothetical protein
MLVRLRASRRMKMISISSSGPTRKLWISALARGVCKESLKAKVNGEDHRFVQRSATSFLKEQVDPNMAFTPILVVTRHTERVSARGGYLCTQNA